MEVPQEFLKFYAGYFPALRNALSIHVKDHRIAEELAQEAFLKAAQHGRRYSEPTIPRLGYTELHSMSPIRISGAR